MSQPAPAALVSSESGAKRRIDYGAIGAVALIAYFVLIGDAASRDTHPIAIVVNAVIAAGLVVLYVLRAPTQADAFDRTILGAVALFAIGAVFSAFPRQSFDSVLGLFAMASALFLARGVMDRPAGRRALIAAFMALSAVLTAVTVVAWLVPYIEWWSLADWSPIPPLGMNFSARAWGHRHDLALLLVMLYPAWWVGRITVLRAIAAILVGAIVLVLVVIDGSRMVWVAIAGATAVVAIPQVTSRLQGYQRLLFAVVATSVAIVIAAVVGIAAEPLAERVLGGASLSERTAMWGSLAEAWTERPIFGYGLGSFPWTLQLTNYFDTHSFSPRHPDSAVVQLLAEAGLVGIAAMALVVVAVAWQLNRSRSRAATWALVAFALAALGGNPTDFDFMVVTAVAWLAYAVPRMPNDASEALRQRPLSRSPVQIVALSILGVVGLAYAATIASAVAYSYARTAVGGARLDAAVETLRLAAALDPGLAIYPRQLGTAYLLSGDAESGVPHLERAVALNPADDLAWRTLGLAYAGIGDDGASRAAIDRAVARQRSDPSNLLLAMRDRIAAGELAASNEMAAEIVQAWPEIVVTHEWSDLTSALGDPEDIAESARRRWMLGKGAPEPVLAQPLMLRALTGDGQAPPRADESRLGPDLSTTYLAVMSCAPAADSAIVTASEQERRQATYWALAVRLAELRHEEAGNFARMFTIMTGDPLLEAGIYWRLNPLDENGARRSSADRWGYRRPTIAWPATEWDLPSPRSGFVMWHLQPTSSLEQADLIRVLPNCL